MSQISNLSSYLEEEEQNKPKASEKGNNRGHISMKLKIKEIGKINEKNV